MNARPTCLTSGWICLLATAVVSTCAPPAAYAEAASVSLSAARHALGQYQLAVDPQGATATLNVIARLTELLVGAELGNTERLEARYLRAAATSDLLVFARVRQDQATPPALESALGAAPGTIFAFLDAELAACSTQAYREPAVQLRAALNLARMPRPWALAHFREAHGSQRDVLFLHALIDAAAADDNPVSALSAYGEDPCAKNALCPAPYAAFDGHGRMAIAALAEAGQALQRLRVAAEAGDPLAMAVKMEQAVFDAVLPAIDLRPSLRPEHDKGWTDSGRKTLEHSAELMLSVSDSGVRYGFMPHAHLSGHGDIELFAKGEPSLPQMATLPFRATTRNALSPSAEFVSWLQRTLPTDSHAPVAVRTEPTVTAFVLSRMLVALTRAGQSEAILVGSTADGTDGAEPVRLLYTGQGDVSEPAELALRIRLGGYSLRLPGTAATQDIPRIQDEHGFHFDTLGLAAQLEGKRAKSSRVSFMPDVQFSTLELALFQLAKSSNSLALLLQ